MTTLDQLQVPLINGYRYSWASIATTIAGFDADGLDEISYKTTVEHGEVRGQGRHNQGFTKGDVKHEASVTMLKEPWNNIVAALGPGYMDYVFGVLVHYEEGIIIHNDKLVGCRFGEEDHSHSRSADPLKVKIKVHLLYWLHDGIPHTLSGPTQ